MTLAETVEPPPELVEVEVEVVGGEGGAGGTGGTTGTEGVVEAAVTVKYALLGSQ